jgi:aryl-alcohol dehydrogenase-like predicted oxidoreductase
VPRDSVVITTKAMINREEERLTSEQVVASLDNSLRLLQTDHVDVFQLHGVSPGLYDHAVERIVPALRREQEKGKFRYLGITEGAVRDTKAEMLARATKDDLWDTVMLAFHMMHQNARGAVLPQTQAKRIGTLLMFAVRSIFAKPERVAGTMRELAAAGQVPQALAEMADPLGFLIHAGGADSLTDAAYRYARHEPGIDVVLFGTGDAHHMESNVASLLKPPLPEADRARLAELFGHLRGVGLEGGAAAKPAKP